MIGFKEIAAATSANDAASEAGQSPKDIVRELGAAPGAVERAATQRALRALGFIRYGNPQKLTLGDIAKLSRQDITLLSALAGIFMDGFAAALRIGRDHGREDSDAADVASMQAAFWRARATELGALEDEWQKFQTRP